MPDLRETWRTDTWVRPFLGRYRRVLFASIGLGVVALIFAVGLMFVSGYLIDAAAAPPYYGLFELLVPIGMVQLFGIGKPLLSYLERLASHDWILRVTSELRRRLYASLERRGPLEVAARRAGEALGLLNEDIAHVQNLYLRTVFPLLIAWIVGGVAVLAMGCMSPWAALELLVGLAIIGLVLPWVALARDARIRERAKERRSEFYTRAWDNMAAVADWRYAGRREDYLSRVDAVAREVEGLEAQLSARSRRRSLILHGVFGVLVVVVFCWAAWHFGGSPGATGVATVLPGSAIPQGASATVNWLAAFVLGMFPLLEAFSPLPDAASGAVGYLDSVARLNAMDDPDGENGGKASDFARETAVESPATSPESATDQTPTDTTIHLDRVTFTYGDGAPVLRDLTLTIPAGQRLAILGPSGTGKSTLAALLRGDLAPQSGSVLLGSREARDLNVAGEMPRHVALMQQSGYLFNQSLMGNLKIGKPQVSAEEARAVLEAVGLGGLLERLRYGLSTMVDEAGIGFSGGEARRVALARILLTDAPVVILDEPCVSLDPSTELALLDTMFRVLEGRTVIMITHHLAGIDHFDRVLFLHDGTVARDGETGRLLDGSPAELFEESPYCRSLLAFDR